MIDIFGPQTPRLLRLITEICDVRPEDLDVVAEAWRRTSVEDRASAWAAIQQRADAEKRIAIQNAALVARHQALIVSQARGQRDSAFWSAAWDAAGALASTWQDGGDSAYRVLVSPMATTLPWLLEGEHAPDIPLQRGTTERGAWNEPVRTSGGGRGR
jgi:hypothetical protein